MRGLTKYLSPNPQFRADLELRTAVENLKKQALFCLSPFNFVSNRPLNDPKAGGPYGKHHNATMVSPPVPHSLINLDSVSSYWHNKTFNVKVDFTRNPSYLPYIWSQWNWPIFCFMHGFIASDMIFVAPETTAGANYFFELKNIIFCARKTRFCFDFFLGLIVLYLTTPDKIHPISLSSH